MKWLVLYVLLAVLDAELGAASYPSDEQDQNPSPNDSGQKKDAPETAKNDCEEEILVCFEELQIALEKKGEFMNEDLVFGERQAQFCNVVEDFPNLMVYAMNCAQTAEAKCDKRGATIDMYTRLYAHLYDICSPACKLYKTKFAAVVEKCLPPVLRHDIEPHHKYQVCSELSGNITLQLCLQNMSGCCPYIERQFGYALQNVIQKVQLTRAECPGIFKFTSYCKEPVSEEEMDFGNSRENIVGFSTEDRNTSGSGQLLATLLGPVGISFLYMAFSEVLRGF